MFSEIEMKENKLLLWSGLIIIFVLVGSYFVKINIEKGVNYNVKSSLLGIIIFYNPLILGIYLLIAISLIGYYIKNLYLIRAK